MTPTGPPTLGENEVNGVVAVGRTASGSIEPGKWFLLSVEAGEIVSEENDHEPPEIAPAVEALDEIADPEAHRVILRAAATDATWQSIAAGDVVAELDAGRLVLDGDESIFIRYLDDCLEVLKYAATRLP